MKNSFGNNITLTLFGESHGEAIGCVIDGIAPGIAVDYEAMELALIQRRGENDISTARREGDAVRIISGVLNGYTEGTPICMIIENGDVRRADYEKAGGAVRPGHADLTAEYKYHGYQDRSGGGHFSGRLTAPIVAAGALVGAALRARGIYVATHLCELGGIPDREIDDIKADAEALARASFPVLDSAAADKMREAIRAARAEGDSIGGIAECAVVGMPVGIGEPWFDTVEGMLAHAVLSCPGVKGIEFGGGFALARMRGSEANDEPYFDTDGTVRTKTNNCGGILGGITNGMPITLRAAIKPTPSIAREQNTVNTATAEACRVNVGGRHDAAIAHRACPVINALVSLTLADLIATHLGTDWLARGSEI